MQILLDSADKSRRIQFMTASHSSLRACLKPLADGAMRSAILGYQLAQQQGCRYYAKGMRVLDVANEALKKIEKIIEEER